MKKSKPFIWITLIFCMACSNELPESFLISGKITNAPEEVTVQLHNSETGELIDSTNLVNGHFQFKGNIDYPRSATLSYRSEDEKNTHYFWLENAEINISSNWHKMMQGQITGGKEQNLQNALDEAQAFFDPEYQRLSKEQKFDSMPPLFERLSATIQQFALKNANSYMGIQNLYRIRDKVEKSTLKEALSRLDEPIKNSPYGQSVLLHSESIELDNGSTFVDFEAPALDGETIALSKAVQEKPALIIFGGLSCMGHRGRATLKEFQKNYGDQVEILAFVFARNQKEWNEDANYDLDVKLLSDLQGDHSPVKIRYGVQATPTVYVIGKDGKIKWKSKGYGAQANEAVISLL